MALPKDVTAIWQGDLNFAAQFDTGQRLMLSSDATQGVSPMETLVAGLAGCTGMDVISILQKKRQNVTRFEVRVHGERVDEHPKKYTAMHVTYVVTGQDVNPEAVRRAIELSENNYCSVAATLRPTVNITSSFEILTPTAEPLVTA